MSVCAPCDLFNKDEGCNHCPLTHYFVNADDMVNLSSLIETYKLRILREKVLDLEKTNSNVTVWIKLEAARCAEERELDERITVLEEKLNMLMKGKEKVTVHSSSTSRTAHQSASEAWREKVPCTRDEFKKLLVALEAHVEKGLDSNLLLWKMIRLDHFQGTTRTSAELEGIWRWTEEVAKMGKTTLVMEDGDLPRVNQVSVALEGWRKAKGGAGLAIKQSKKAGRESKKVSKK